MNANEARRLNELYAETQGLSEENIDKQIEQAANRGRSSTSVNLQKVDYGYRDRVFERIKGQFEAKGFKVSRNKYSGDMRDPSGHDVANISW